MQERIVGMRRAVHPRTRGEHTVATWPSGFFAGSSPHARGTRSAELRHVGERRFIPVRAGNTPPAARRRCWPTVHPRTRGEHHTRSQAARRSFGSSPHARGTRQPDLPLLSLLGFIPARAGNTIEPRPMRKSESVHPRTRGEHSGIAPVALCQPDIIPARAGNTATQEPNTGTSTVHPRTRGEHYYLDTGRGIPYGSSPHARGTPVDIPE